MSKSKSLWKNTLHLCDKPGCKATAPSRSTVCLTLTLLSLPACNVHPFSTRISLSKAESSALAQALGVRLLFTLQADPQVLLNARSKEKPIVAGDGIQSGKQTQTHVLQQWNV